MKSLPFPKPKKKKLKSLSLYKAEAWGLFSEYIRRKEANPEGYNPCVCCHRPYHWKELHAGHLVAGRRLGILFDERGVWPCCYGCNVGKNGNYREYDAYIDLRFGRDYRLKLVEELRRKAKEPTKWTRDQYQEVIDKYTELLIGLEEKA